MYHYPKQLHPATPVPVPPPILPPRTHAVTAQSIAKKHRTARQRACIAARWVTGGLYLRPTVKLAATACGCSVPLVAEEITKLNGNQVELIDLIWNNTHQAARDAFARRHMESMWLTMDRVTAAD